MDGRAAVGGGQRVQAGGAWHMSRGLIDPHGPLWYECLQCRRLRTIEAVDAAPPNADDGARWRCTACGWSRSARRIYDDQTDLLINLVESPDCPPVVLRLLERCGWLLHWISQGDAMAIGQSADAARHAVRILDHFGDREPWFDDAE